MRRNDYSNRNAYMNGRLLDMADKKNWDGPGYTFTYRHSRNFGAYRDTLYGMQEGISPDVALSTAVEKHDADRNRVLILLSRDPRYAKYIEDRRKPGGGNVLYF